MATIITKTIGQDGWQDFSAIQQATDAITTSDVANTADLVAADIAVVFEIYAGVYDESVEINESLTCDATRNVTYKPAAGSEHGGSVSKGVRISPSVGTAFANLRDDFVTLDGLVIDCNSNGIATIATDGLSVRNCIIDTGGMGIQATYGNTGTASAPLTVENCVISSPSRPIYFAALYGAAGPIHFAVRNCTMERTSGLDAILTHNTGDTNYGEFTNNIILNGGFNQSGSNILAGSDNIGPAGTFSWPSALQAGSQSWTFTTDRTAASTGSQVVYDANDFSLINVAGNDAVGVGTATGVPTTDINGEDRVRGVGTQYVDPGAFTSDLFTYTRTIGPGRHYDDFGEAEGAVTSIPRDTNLAQQNLAIVFEADAGTYNEYVTISSSLTTDATRNVTYRPAEGSEHGGVPGQGVRVQFGNLALQAWCISVNDPFTAVEGLEFDWTDSGGTGRSAETQNNIEGVAFRDCILRHAGTGVLFQSVQSNTSDTLSFPVQISNCVLDGSNAEGFRVWNYGASDKAWTVTNCTIKCGGKAFDIYSATNDSTYTITNNLVLAASDVYLNQGGGGTNTVLGSNNVGGSTNPFPAALQAEGQTWTTTTDTTAASTGNQVIYTSTTGKLVNVSGNDVLGVGTASAAPTTDINGVSRIRGASNEYADPGAFSVDKITYTRTIGKDGWQDYDDFIAAEGATTVITDDMFGGVSRNLAKRNGRIIFDVYKGTYAEQNQQLFFNPDLTFGPNTNITYRAAEGSEHGGEFGAGVNLVTNPQPQDDFTKFDGIQITSAARTFNFWKGKGVEFANGLGYVVSGHYTLGFIETGSLEHPTIVKNCKLYSESAERPILAPLANITDTSMEIINCTIDGSPRNSQSDVWVAAVAIGNQSSGGKVAKIKIDNILNLSQTMADFTTFSSQATNKLIFQGSSSNVGAGVDTYSSSQYTRGAFPSTLQAEGQTWTFSTSATAPSTGSQVIYDDTTGALVNVSGNDAVGVGTGTQAPTTDINGVSRIRGADDEYADPGAFTTSLKEIVRSVGSTSRDYETLTLAKNAAEGLSTNLNLAQRNEKIIFEFYDDGTPQYNTTIDTNLISDPERHVQYKNAPGQDVRITHTAGSYLNMQIKDSFTHWSLGTSNNGVDHRLWVVSDSNNLETKGVVIENCTLSSTTNSGAGINFRLEFDAQQIGSMGTKKHPHIVRNARFFTGGFSQIGGGPKGSFVKIENCTFAGIIAGHAPGNVINYARANQHVVPEDLIEIRNCVNLDSAAGDANIAAGFTYYQGSNNVGGATGQFNFKFSYLGMGTDFTSTSSVDASSTGTQVIYDASGRLVNVSGNDAVGFGDGSYAPSADINGVSRLRGANNEYADPGAFTTDLVSISNTISEGTAVADIQQAFNDIDDNIQTQINSYNLAKRNATYSLMFKPGTYDLDDDYLIVPSTLTGDLNRRVTITCTPGGEHGGDVSGGVLLRQRGSGNSVIAFEDDTTIKNIAIERYDDAYNRHTLMPRNEKRVLIENVIAWNNTSGTSNSFIFGNTDEGAEIILSAINCKTINMQYMAWGNTTPTKSLDFTVKNCVMYSDNGAGTAISRTNGDLIVGFKSLKLYNNVGINVSATAQLFTSHQGGRKIYMEGAGNVVTNRGSLTANAFLAESQTWTFSTDAAASSTGSQAIYDASTYALVNVSGNDAVGVGDGTNAPTTDIAGNSRIRGLNDDYADPGAYTTDKITILKRVADLGYQNSESQYDYGSLRDVKDNVLDDARDALSDDQSRVNLAQRNYELVYEFRAGDYTGADNRAQIISTNNLIFGPTNRLILRPEQGSEHNGDFDKGVRFFGTGYGELITFYPNSPDGILFADWEGMVTKIDDATPAGRLSVVTYKNSLGAAHCGGSVKNCLDRSTFTSTNNDRHFVGNSVENTIGSKKYPILVENNVSIRPGSCIFIQHGGNVDHAAFIKATNNTFICRWFLARNNYYDSVYPGTLELEQNNNILIPSSEIEGGQFNNYYLETVTLQGDEDFYEGTTKITGKNNYSFTGVVQDVDNIGNGRNYKTVEIPGSLKGSIYPVNYTTDTTSTSADTFIYDANNFSAVNVSGNALIGLGDSSLTPSADIRSASRIRLGLGTQYADPGAFTSDIRTISKTIDNTGNGDYTTLVESEAALALTNNPPLSTNLVLRNEEIVFNTIPGQTITETSHISVTGVPPAGPKNRIIWRCPDPTNRTLVDSTSTIGGFLLKTPYITIENINFRTEKYAVAFAADANSDVVGCLIKNCVMDSYGPLAPLKATKSTMYSVGTREEPNIVENVVTKGPSALSTYWPTNPAHAGTGASILIRNCTHMDSTNPAISQNNAWNFESAAIRGTDYSIMEINNCLNLASGGQDCPVAGLLGSGNVGNSDTGTNSFTGKGVGINLNPTTNTSPGAGDWSIFTSATGKLINVSANDAIGVGTASAAPITDINGVSRIRGANNEYVDPGAYSVDTITTTKTIGIGGAASGFDFDSFTNAEAAVDTTAIVYDSNLAQRNLAIVFEADAGTYSELGTVTISSQLITDATRNVTYKPANGAEHGGDESAGVIVQPSTGATPFDVRDNFTVLDGLVMKGTAVNSNGIQTGSGSAEGVRVKNCIIVADAYPLTLYGGGTAANPIRVESCVAKGLNTAPVARLLGLQRALFAEISNCTLLGGGTGVETNSHSFNTDAGLVNILRVGNAYNETVGSGALTVTGSNNVGGSGSPFPSLLQAESQTWTFSTSATAPSTGNQVIYTSATGELVNVSGNDAVGIGTATGVPATDINGVSRLRGANNEYADPGAFTTDLLTFNRKIGPYREYTTFNDAESDVVAISTDGNLAQRNEAIVFEADAGNYTENFAFFTGGALTCDPTRNVTFKAAAGSEHGGNFESGVNIIGSCGANESFAVVDGLSVSPSTGGAASISLEAVGAILRNVMAYSTNGRAFTLGRGGTASNPCVVENCVGKSDSSRPFDIRSDGAAQSHWRVVNCTAMATGINQGFIIGSSSTGNTIYLELVNNVVNGGTARSYFESAGATYVVTGSGNAGPNDGSAAFPAAVQAGSQTWTTTTDTTAASTGNQIVYEAATGKILAVSGNDAIGIATTVNVPTTDIKGTSRLRGVGTQYADPGAFTTDVNTITKTIGIGGAASGFDFDSFTDAEAAVATSAVTYDTNLVEKNIAIVFEADAGTYNETITFQSSLTTDATRNVTYKPATGSEHGGDKDAGVIIDGASTTPIGLRDSYMVLRGLNIKSQFTAVFLALPTTGRVLEGLIIGPSTTTGGYTQVREGADQTVFRNCVFRDTGAWCVNFSPQTVNGSNSCEFLNCTFSPATTAILDQPSVAATLAVRNCAFLTGAAMSDAPSANTTRTGGGNVTSTALSQTSLLAESQTWTFTTDTAQPSTGNQVIYTSATGALVNVSGNDALGVGTGSAINVPASDILGKSRLRGLSNEYVDPGAFTTDIKTTTLTANPGTLSSLILNLTPYITTANIAKRNESIVIELEKADYPEFNFRNLEDIIGDSVRNITIKPQEGAYHKGIRGAGIRFITANTGYDTFGIQDASGFTIEGVEFYAPSGDIGRYLTVTRNSEATTYKDVIFNNVEKPGMRTMQSWYGNGKVSPLSFRNCLFITEEVCISIATQTDEQIQGKYELTNCTLSSLNAFRAAIQFDCVHEGTFEVNLTNNLFLGTGRNIGNRWIGQTGGFFGDAFFYGSNNTGPDTPNYQLPTAIRASIYPILPTTDYTPLPADPAAVYKPKTLQLLDIPNNDAVGLGVGTENPLVPAQGIGGEARSTSSCNPGCWESQYELVDLQLNTLRGVEGFRNVFKGPSTNFAHAVLPDDTVPVFIVVGDSTAQGFSNTPDDNGYRETTISWPDNAFDGSAYGYFWDKYMSTSDNGVTWTRPYPDFINPSTSGTGFVPLNPRMGGIGVGSFTYADPVGTPTQVGGCSPIWDFAVDISGIFRNSAGETLAPHFIFIAVTGSRLGSDGPPGPGTTEFNFSPSGGYLYNTLIESYVKPAVDDIMNNSKNPLLVGSVVLHGGTEAKIDYNPNPNGNKVSASGVDTYANFLRGIQTDTKIGGIWPYMFYAMWQTLPDGSTAQTDYPKQYTDAMNKALSVFHNVHINRMVNLVDLLRDKTEAGDPAIDGIHFLQRSYPRYGQRFGDYYRSLLSMNKYPIYGRTLSDIFDE